MYLETGFKKSHAKIKVVAAAFSKAAPKAAFEKAAPKQSGK